MAHYKNNNKNNFIPTENKKKKKKFTKEQLIVFILMIFWSISSVFGIIAFTSNVVKAEEPLTVYAEEPDYNYSPPKYNDVSYNEFNPCDYPTMNLLGAEYMLNPCFTSRKTTTGMKYTLTRTADSFVSEWFYFPFILTEGTYTATIEDLDSLSASATQISLQFQTSNGVNYYVRFKLSTAFAQEDISVSFDLSNATGSDILVKHINKVRFICSNTYSVGTYFTFNNPTLYKSDIAYPYSPYFGTYCDIASDYAYEKGWQDSGEAYDDGYEKGYDEGYLTAENDFREKYGLNDLGVLNDIKAFGTIYGNNYTETFTFSNLSPQIVADNAISYDFLYTTNFSGLGSVDSVKLYLYFPYEINPLVSYFFSHFSYKLYYQYLKIDTSTESLIDNNYTFSGSIVNPFYPDTSDIDYGLPIMNDAGFYKIQYFSLSTFKPTSEVKDFNCMSIVWDREKDGSFTPGLFSLFNYMSINSISYDLGYDTGKQDGIKEVTSTENYINALNNAKEEGKAIGYKEGVEDANNYTFLGLMGAVVDAPLNAFIRMFDFDILGFNMKSLYLSLFTACLLIVIVKKVI